MLHFRRYFMITVFIAGTGPVSDLWAAGPPQPSPQQVPSPVQAPAKSTVLVPQTTYKTVTTTQTVMKPVQREKNR